MQSAHDVRDPDVGLWLDPVCPFSWNTARWLAAVAEAGGFDIDLHMMSLAVLNEGQTLPPPAQSRMADSRLIGRLMVAIESELGQTALAAAYFAFGSAYFDQDAAVDDHLAEQVLTAAGARSASASAMQDSSWDTAVRRSHDAAQEALGASSGSPLLTIGGRTFFGPVLTSVPGHPAQRALFDAITVMAQTPEFSQLECPRESRKG